MTEPVTTPDPFPRSRAMIEDAIEEAIFDAFGIEPPEGNSRPIKGAERKTKGNASAR